MIRRAIDWYRAMTAKRAYEEREHTRHMRDAAERLYSLQQSQEAARKKGGDDESANPLRQREEGR